MGLVLGMAAAANANAQPVGNPNLLSDPGFESGTSVPSSMGGWWAYLHATFSQTYQHSGAWSMETYYSGNGFQGFSVQKVAATPGVTYSLTGWAFTPNTLGSSSSVGFVTLAFLDVNGLLIGPILTSPMLNNASPANIWTQLSLSGTAPANTVSMIAETMLLNSGPGDAVYFDDLSLTVVPEPSTSAWLSAGLGFGLLVRRYHRRAA